MKIVGVVGILDLPRGHDPLWRHLRQAFLKEFPGSTFTVENSFYFPWQGERMRALAERILEKYDDGSDLLFVGYSMGGVIACAITPKFKKSRVLGIATIGSPHRVSVFYKMLGTERPRLKMPVCTFAGVIDPIVPWFLATFPSAHSHANIFFDHLLWLLLSARPARIIAHTLKKSLAEG